MVRGSGPGDLFWCPGFRNRIHYFFPGASRAHASPTLPKEAESRWHRPAVRESQGGDSFGPLGSVAANAACPSLLSHMLAFVSGWGGFSWDRYPGQQGLITNRTHPLCKGMLEDVWWRCVHLCSRKLPWFPSVLRPVSFLVPLTRPHKEDM